MPTAEQIRSARKALGESQTAFASRFGVHQGTVARWEKKGTSDRANGRAALRDFLEKAAPLQTEAAE